MRLFEEDAEGAQAFETAYFGDIFQGHVSVLRVFHHGCRLVQTLTVYQLVEGSIHIMGNHLPEVGAVGAPARIWAYGRFETC